MLMWFAVLLIPPYSFGWTLLCGGAMVLMAMTVGSERAK